MTITAFDGPLVTFPASPQTGTPSNTNPESGPSMFNHGMAILDPRYPFTYLPGQNFGKQVSGWLAVRSQTIDQVPYTTTANNLAGAQTATAGTAMTLRSASATGITAGVSIVNALTGATVTGLLAIDSAMTTVTFGQAGTIQIWDPTKAISRNVTITSNGTDTTGSYTVKGYDIYGFPLTETITGAAGVAGTTALAQGAKAFKYIASVTPNATVNSTGATVGVGDIIGLPLRADRFPELSVSVGNTAIVASTGFTAGVTTAATATSGDVRGTYGLQSSSNGVLRIAVYQAPQVSNVSSSTGLVGVAQYSGS